MYFINNLIIINLCLNDIINGDLTVCGIVSVIDQRKFVGWFNAQNDSELFSIDELTGDVRLTFDPDFENPKDAGSNPDIADNIYGFVVVATDQAGNTAEKRVSLEVQDIQLAPIATSPSRVSINENTGAPQPIYTTQIEDYPYPMMYGLKNVNDSESFTIDVSTGIVSLKSTEFPDFETKNLLEDHRTKMHKRVNICF